MLDASAIKEIASMWVSDVEDHEGILFHKTAGKIQRVEFPNLETFHGFSLTQIISFLKEAVSKMAVDEKVWINIVDQSRVEVMSNDWNSNKEYETLAESDFSKVLKDFPFGSYMSQEDFIINLQTRFVMDDSIAQLMKFVSQVRSGTVNTSDDDGVSQTVQTKAGVHLSSEAKVQPIWKLKTYKTFPEIEQPVIPYIFRVKQKGDETPTFALFDCDGGKWKVDTTIAIRGWLQQVLKTELADKADKVVVM